MCLKYIIKDIRADLDDRQKLYQTLAEKIWNPENLLHNLDT